MTVMARARAAFVAFVFCAPPAIAAEVEVRQVRAASADELAYWDAALSRMMSDGSLRVRQVREDTMIAGRENARLAQFHRGVPVFGGELVVQTERGRALTVFGTLYEGLELDVRPALSPETALTIVQRRGFAPVGADGGPELLVLPGDEGVVLAYRMRAKAASGVQVNMIFVDAQSGAIALEYNDLKSQAVGSGRGVLNDEKKVSTRAEGGVFLADDRLRPPALSTFDFKGDIFRFLNNSFIVPLPSDLATDSDNVWTDGANVDAHAYLGYVYDYYFRRFGRRGLDNANLPIRGITHPVRREEVFRFPNTLFPELYCNAFYFGDGLMVFGEGLPFPTGGQTCDYLAGALDVVGHELTHGVTDYTSRLIYRNESGALNEAFSDIMGTAIEFFYQAPGSGPLRADYEVGEDVVVPGGVRSMRSPIVWGDPDHYSIRYTGVQDSGGVHINSGIVNHVYYLAIEGGTNRVSGLSVQGVGTANREQMERVFYRAFTTLLVPSSNFSQARAATIQAARDLFGANSAPERSVTQAWTAVGVN